MTIRLKDIEGQIKQIFFYTNFGAKVEPSPQNSATEVSLVNLILSILKKLYLFFFRYVIEDKTKADLIIAENIEDNEPIIDETNVQE